MKIDRTKTKNMPGLAKELRPAHDSQLKWLPKKYFVEAAPEDCIGCLEINPPNSLYRLLQKNELDKGVVYLSEGLITTYPEEYLAKAVRKFMEPRLSSELKQLTLSEAGLEHSDDPVFMHSDHTPYISGKSLPGVRSNCRDKKFCHTVCYFVPVYTKDKDRFERLVRKLAEDVYYLGYGLSVVRHFIIGEITVLLIQFEAKFMDDDVELNGVLYHVTPVKYLGKIAKNGLVPLAKNAEFSYNGRIYLFNTPSKKLPLWYGQYKAKAENDDGFALLCISGEKLKNYPQYKSGKLKFYFDTAFADDDKDNSLAVFTYGNIPPSLIDNTCDVYDKNGKIVKRNFKFK